MSVRPPVGMLSVTMYCQYIALPEEVEVVGGFLSWASVSYLLLSHRNTEISEVNIYNSHGEFNPEVDIEMLLYGMNKRDDLVCTKRVDL